MRRPLAALAAAGLLSLAAGCGTPDAGSTPATATATLTVFAAASLKAPFSELGTQFQTGHPGTTVRFTFAGSADLVAQLQQGAPADVFAAADTTTMDKAAADQLLQGTPVTFASNTLEIAVPPDNPAGVASLRDLTKADTRVVVCAPEVPCGAATRRVETAGGVQLRPVSEESSVTDVVNKVRTGEADAGLVYVTDVRAAGDGVVGIAFPEAAEALNHYPIATLAGASNAELARQFVELVTGPQGRQVLADAGFGKP